MPLDARPVLEIQPLYEVPGKRIINVVQMTFSLTSMAQSWPWGNQIEKKNYPERK